MPCTIHTSPCSDRERPSSSADAANTVALTHSQIDPLWLDFDQAEAAAKKAGEDLWEGHLVFTFGKYSGQSFSWGTIWAGLCGYWQNSARRAKQRMLPYATVPTVTFHLDKRLEEQESRKERIPGSKLRH
ncbi:unnamed protein product [Knipowitschia caucasica]|uniref:Uncharacterized protein n=1 Tax=Knipowitschia caucasica TaxID=637954 RepID=A0AAV2KUU2_KNICA